MVLSSSAAIVPRAYILVPVEATGTPQKTSPLAEFMRARVQRVLASVDATGSPADLHPGRAALRRFLDALDALADAADALDGQDGSASASTDRTAAGSRVLLSIEDADLASEAQRNLEPDHRVEVASTRELAFRSAIARTPDLVAACGVGAIELVRGLRELQSGLPAIVAATDSDMPRFLEAFADDPLVVLRAPLDGRELALAIRALLGAPRMEHGRLERHAANADSGTAALSAWKGSGEPKSYAHLAGLLPRALERTIDFDVAAAVIARPGGEPLVDVHAASHCSDETLRLVHDRALALFRLVAGGAQRQEDVATATAPSDLCSSLHVPLATEGRVVGLTYLASFRAGAFAAEDERVVAALAAHASGAYRRLEATLRRLRLTPRQAQVLSLIASGLSDKEVASQLGLAHRTVRTHLDRLLREHGLHSRTEAVAAWLRGQQD